jgi:hypothetical protein
VASVCETAAVPRCLAASLTIALALAGQPAAAVAVLSAEAPGLLHGAREALDANIHGTLASAGVDVLPLDRTARFIKDAADACLACSLTEDDCALRAAVAAGADAVVVPRVVRIDDRVVMVLRQLSLDGAPAGGAAGIVEEAPGVAPGLTALARRLRDPTAAPPTPLPLPLAVEPLTPSSLPMVACRTAVNCAPACGSTRAPTSCAPALPGTTPLTSSSTSAGATPSPRRGR